ncbi:FMN-binding protein [Maribacter confluentis]|uniref:FMN-binding protein n=1 Tax=Maribacter confluentis TaxID=1656093 RepID=A0ABT8RTF0_9FLAO|nr:FMN-binding protein [Maribacter confluentis]MDO1513883.1 FMN-binding protein [Maribacter confluentis]
MRTKIIMLLLGFLLLNCKDRSPAIKEIDNTGVTQEKAITPVPSVITDLGKFIGITFSDSLTVDDVFNFKKIDLNNVVVSIDMTQSVLLYKKMTKREKASSFPIFEVKNTSNVILLVQGLGFGGPIWAIVSLDTNTLEIKNIAFDHFAESDGYGAAMTHSTFEDEFIGSVINLEDDTFMMQKNLDSRIDDGVIIDGISGATMTSAAAIQMVNKGLMQYKEYLRP